MAVNKKILSAEEKATIEAKKDAFIEMLQKQVEGTDDLTLGKVFEWVKLQMEEQGYQKIKQE